MSGRANIEQETLNIKLECDYETETISEDKQEHDIDIKKDPLELEDERNEATDVQCDICRQYCAGAQELGAHRYNHTSDVKFTCLVCHNGCYINKAELAKHICRKHSSSPVKTSLVFIMADIIRKKMRVPVDSSELKRSQTARKPYDICHREFTLKQLHTGVKPYDCNICHMRFIKKSYLTIHMRKHTGEKPYVCDICNLGFSQKGGLTAHMRTHTGERPFACYICHMRFSQKSTLTTHVRTHTRAKPCACDICHKQFTARSTLRSHMRTHTGEKPYECDICHLRFSQKGTLTTHGRTHAKTKPM